MLIILVFWKSIPVNSIPTNAGNVVRLISHPPKCADILSNINWNNFPSGGAAVSPSIAYSIHHENVPIRIRATILENCRYVGQKGRGQNFCHLLGCHEGLLFSSSAVHFTKIVYHQEELKNKSTH